MDRPLTKYLEEVPKELFYNEKGDPAYNKIFVEIARQIYRQDQVEFSIPAHDFLSGKLPNLSTFQKSVSKERKRREGSSGRN